MIPEELLATYVGIPGKYEPSGTCVAWIESRDGYCAKPVDHLLCRRHRMVGLKRHDADSEKKAAQQARYSQQRARQLPKWRQRLDQVNKRIAVLDPPPLTTDRAAWGGEIHRSILRSRPAMSDARVEEMARLHRERDNLIARIGRADA